MRANHLCAILVVIASATMTGCARRGRVAQPPAAAIRMAANARVTNNNWLDVRVYAVQAGSRESIGIVRSFDTQLLELPRHLLEARSLRLYVDPIGSPQSYQTDLISVWPGQLIDLVVQERINQSHYSVFNP